MKPYLVADVGGTHLRLALYQADAQTLQHVQVLPCTAFASLSVALQHYLAQYPAYSPEHACIAIATPLQGDWVSMTNSTWAFSIQALQTALHLQTLLLVNDFAALALALPQLTQQQVRKVCGGHTAADRATRALLGAGTGLGVSGLLWGTGQWHPIIGEGGHNTYVPLTAREQAVAGVLSAKYGHVSFERVVSGMGLVNLYQALCQLDAVAAADYAAAGITQQALAQQCPRCMETVDLFCAALGTVAGNVALTLGATGGVYIGGGIVPRLGEQFDQSPFAARFVAKGRFQDYLAALPVYVITDPVATLWGATTALQRELS